MFLVCSLVPRVRSGYFTYDIWFDPMQAESGPEACPYGHIYTGHHNAWILLLSLSHLQKKCWKPGICTGTDQILIILAANRFGSDTHSQICGWHTLVCQSKPCCRAVLPLQSAALS